MEIEATIIAKFLLSSRPEPRRHFVAL